jgi:arsenite methyltransferase
LPKAIRAAAELHVGCVAGAMEQEQYLELIRAVGFSEVQIAESRTLELPDSLLSQHLDGEEIAAFRAAGTRLLSVTVLGTRPFTACCGESCCR